MPEIGNWPMVSVIVTAKNEENTIENCILSIMNQSYPNFELIYVDAISSDKTFEKANRLKNVSESKKNCKRYLAVSKKAETPATGRNLGAEISNGSILAFTDADCVAEKDWLENLVLHMSPEIGIVGGPNVIRHIIKSKITTAIDSVLGTYIGSGGSPQFYQIKNDRDVYAVSSCNMAIQKNLFEREGGFDESLRFNEDSDFCNRLLRKGNRIFYTPTARINHFIGIETYSQFVSYFYKYGFERGKNVAKNIKFITRFNALSLGLVLFAVSLLGLAFLFSIASAVLVFFILIIFTILCIFSLKIAVTNKSPMSFFLAFAIFLSLHIVYTVSFIAGYLYAAANKMVQNS